MLEALQAGIAAQLTPLDDPGLTGTGKSVADMLGVSAVVLVEKLTGHVLREITVRSARGGPLAPLPAQLNYDMTHLQAQQLEGMLGRLADVRLDVGLVLESVGSQTKVAGHAFISYAREDSDRVGQLQRKLQAAGVPVWRDTADLWPGEDWRMKIRRAITDNALVFIACFSQASLARSKSYQNEELTLAIEQLRWRPVDDPWLIPVRFDECEVPERDIGGGRTLASIQRADLFGDRSNEGAARVVAAVLRILGQQTDAATASVEEIPAPVIGSATHRLEKVDDTSNVDALISAGEGEKVEFKSSLNNPYGAVPWNSQRLPPGQDRKQVQKAIRKGITKTIAAFLNTVGGTLLIGISDSGAVLGIEPDFAYLRQGKNNADGWLLSLKDAIGNALGPEVWSAINVSLVRHGQQTVAVIRCTRRMTETWHREEGREQFYIRTSNATQELTGSSVLRYIRERWPS